jgi:hypothetical protein
MSYSSKTRIHLVRLQALEGLKTAPLMIFISIYIVIFRDKGGANDAKY